MSPATERTLEPLEAVESLREKLAIVDLPNIAVVAGPPGFLTRFSGAWRVATSFWPLSFLAAPF